MAVSWGRKEGRCGCGDRTSIVVKLAGIEMLSENEVDVGVYSSMSSFACALEAMWEHSTSIYVAHEHLMSAPHLDGVQERAINDR